MKNRIVINGKKYKIVGEAKNIDGSLMQEIEPLSDEDYVIDEVIRRIDILESKIDELMTLVTQVRERQQEIKRGYN